MQSLLLLDYYWFDWPETPSASREKAGKSTKFVKRESTMMLENFYEGSSGNRCGIDFWISRAASCNGPPGSGPSVRRSVAPLALEEQVVTMRRGA